MRIWSFKLRAGASATVEARFEDDGAHWIVIMKDRGPGIDVTLGRIDTRRDSDTSIYIFLRTFLSQDFCLVQSL